MTNGRQTMIQNGDQSRCFEWMSDVRVNLILDGSRQVCRCQKFGRSRNHVGNRCLALRNFWLKKSVTHSAEANGMDGLGKEPFAVIL